MTVRRSSFYVGLFLWLLLASCRAAPLPSAADAVLTLPELTAVSLQNRQLAVVATTSVMGDVVAQVGGTAIDLTVLMGAGQDPHSYEPSARDLTAVANADVVFVNGWNLEEGLVDSLQNVAETAPIVPISAGIEPLLLGETRHDEHADEAEDEHHEHAAGAPDPHVWLDPQSVVQWVDNVVQVLGALDPANTAVYEQNAAAYQQQLAELQAYADAELAKIPAANRLLVTNHDSLGYLARRYGFELLGTVLPTASTVADASAADLAALAATMTANNVCTLFTDATASPQMAQSIADELTACDSVAVLPLYTGAVAGEGGYIGMMRANIDTLVIGLGS